MLPAFRWLHLFEPDFSVPLAPFSLRRFACAELAGSLTLMFPDSHPLHLSVPDLQRPLSFETLRRYRFGLMSLPGQSLL